MTRAWGLCEVDARVGQAFFLIGLVVFTAIRVPHDRRRRRAGFNVMHVSRAEWVLLSCVFLSIFVLPLAAIFTPWLQLAEPASGRMALPLARLVAGVVVLVSALLLFHRSHADLGLNWSPVVETRAAHDLVVTGVYRFIRHPMYASFILYGVAQALLLTNWVAGPSVVLAGVLLYAARVRGEERLLAERFGQAYADYAARTPRLVPGMW